MSALPPPVQVNRRAKPAAHRASSMKYVRTLPLLLPASLTALALVTSNAWAQAAPSATNAVAAAAAQQENAGLLRGRVVADGSGTPLAGVLVTVKGGGHERYAKTDSLGEFAIELPAGTYDVELSHPQFDNGFALGVNVQAGAEQSATFTMTRGAGGTAASARNVEEVVVTGTYRAGSVDTERFSENVVDVISAEDFRVTGDSDAVAALARVTGLTVVNDKYVYVRGLGERYSSTTFNGAKLPSPDPIRRVVPMDLFPTGALDAVNIQKTYSPDLPADFSGGAVQLVTRTTPDEQYRRLAFRVETNDQTTDREAISYDGGSKDWLGYDDGYRDLPTTVKDTDLSSASPEDVQTAGLAMRRDYPSETRNLPANFGVEAGFGDSLDNGFGYLVGARYENDWAWRREERRTSGGDGQGGAVARDDINQARTENNMDFSALLNLEYALDDSNTLRSATFLTRSTDKRTIRSTGHLDENDIDVADTEFEWEERQLLTQQFSGEHYIAALHDLKIDWQGTWAEATREKPDRRFYRYEAVGALEDGSLVYQFSRQGGSNERSWENLTDKSLEGALDFTLPVAFTESITSDLKLGFAYLDKDRDSEYRRFRFETDFSLNNLEEVLGYTPDVVFSDPYIAPGLWELLETTQATDNYTATEKNSAGYLMADTQFGDHWRLMLGARYEDSQLETVTFDRLAPTNQIVSSLDDSDVLPAITATWSITESMQVRAGYSKTLNRPDLRELSPAPFLDPEERYVVIGNPDLVTAEIDNYDVRWEWYWSTVDNVQLALFYKDFTNPIESFILFGGSQGGARSFQNADSATNQGVELQVRSGLGGLSDALVDFFVRFNAAYIDSEVKVPENAQETTQNRPLQGQSDWVANVQLGYDNPVREIEAALLFNMAGDRINAVGVRGLPDAIEESVPRLDFNYRQGVDLFGQKFTLQVKGLNLLDPDYKVTRGDVVERRYKLGRTLYLGASYDF
jgi:TonB-dependent receptor